MPCCIVVSALRAMPVANFSGTPLVVSPATMRARIVWGNQTTLSRKGHPSSARRSRSTGNSATRSNLPTSLEGTAAALCLRGRATAAARLLGASEEVRRKLTLPGLPIEIALRQSALDMVAASVTEDERERELIVGRRWNVEETVAYARGEIASIDTPIHPG